MILKKSILTFIVILFAACETDALGTEVPVVAINLIGKWQLSETYISPGGATEWMDVSDGGFYVFRTNNTYKRLANDETLQEEGIYRIEADALFLDFEFEGESQTQGFRIEITDKTITLSPSFPAICIEGCSFRYKKQ